MTLRHSRQSVASLAGCLAALVAKLAKNMPQMPLLAGRVRLMLHMQVNRPLQFYCAPHRYPPLPLQRAPPRSKLSQIYCPSPHVDLPKLI